MKAASDIKGHESASGFNPQKKSIENNAFIVSLLVIFILAFSLDAYRLKFAPEAINLSIAVRSRMIAHLPNE